MKLTIDQALQQAVAAHKEGRLQDAERLYSAILQSQPEHPDANHNLGLLAVSVNKADSALPLFRTALEANPKIEQFWLSYIDALIKADQLTDAQQVIEKAKNQGVGANKLSSFEETLLASSQRTNATSAHPSQRKLNSLLEHYQNGRYAEAEKLAVSITQEFPGDILSWEVLGALYRKEGRFSESLSAMQKTVELEPQNAEAHYNMGVILQDLERYGEAEKSYSRALELEPDLVRCLINLASTLQALGRNGEAEACYNRAKALDPKNAVIFCNLGVLQQELGRPDAAEASLERAIALRSDFAVAHRYLALLKNFNSQDEQYLKMQQLYLDRSVSDEERTHIAFGLAKANEDLGNYKKAFSYYKDGNTLRKKLLKYSIDSDVEQFRQIKSAYPNIEKEAITPDEFPVKLMPIFIVGMLRSGTTLVEQIISSHSQVTGAGELPFVDELGSGIANGRSGVKQEVLLRFRHEYLDKLRDFSNGNLIITDKMPQNFRYVGLLAAAFPEAKIIHVKRNPAAVCWANYTQYFPSNNLGYCYSIKDIRNYLALYENLMEFWAERLSERIYELDYELLTSDQENETRQLIKSLGLGWDNSCLSPESNTRSVKTASSLQIRKKVYQNSSQRWRKYQPFLNGALDSLA